MKQFTFYQDEKVTIWQRTHFEVEAKSLKEAKKIVENNLKEMSPYDMDNMEVTSTEYLTETHEELTVEDNGGESTLETYYEDGKLITSNV